MDTIVSLDFPPDIGGAHLWLYEVYRRWPEPVAVLTVSAADGLSGPDGPVRFDGPLAIHASASRSEINLFSPHYLAHLAREARQVSAMAGDVRGPRRIHALRAFPEGLTAMVGRHLSGRDARLITYAHGEEVLVAETSRQLRWIAKQVYSRSDLVIANSWHTRDLVVRMSPQAKVEVIHPGVDTSLLRPGGILARRQLRSRFGWREDQFVLFSVSRMEPRKNQATVIRAIHALRARGVNVAFVCAGDGETRPQLKRLIASLGLDEYVVMLGRVSDSSKAALMAGCDAHVLVSVRSGQMIEGFGIVFMEAAACGVPSIAGDSGGQAEAVLHDRTGLVVDGTDLDKVIDAIGKVATDRALRTRLGESALAWSARHDWDAVAKRTRAAVHRMETS